MTFEILNAQSSIKFRFYDSCVDSVLTLDYDLSLISDSSNQIQVKDSAIIKQNGLYMIQVFHQHGDYYAWYDFTKELKLEKEYNDTIELPKISCWYSQALHTQYWKFHYCNRLCNGHEIAYYREGGKWIEGDFEEGIPRKKIKYYDRKGKLVKIEIYNKRGFKRIRYLDFKSYVENN